MLGTVTITKKRQTNHDTVIFSATNNFKDFQDIVSNPLESTKKEQPTDGLTMTQLKILRDFSKYSFRAVQ